MEDDREILLAQLSACLALVRPVGMTEGETMDWLAVAADALSELPIDIAEVGCRKARLKCTHHSQIVPTVISETQDMLEWRRMSQARPVRLVSVRPEPTPIEHKPEPLPDPESLMPSLRRMGLQKGWLTERDGRVQWSEDAA